jgi:hypothetical protein
VRQTRPTPDDRPDATHARRSGRITTEFSTPCPRSS